MKLVTLKNEQLDNNAELNALRLEREHAYRIEDPELRGDVLRRVEARFRALETANFNLVERMLSYVRQLRTAQNS